MLKDTTGLLQQNHRADLNQHCQRDAYSHYSLIQNTDKGEKCFFHRNVPLLSDKNERKSSLSNVRRQPETIKG